MARYEIVPDRSFVWIEARSTVHPIRTRTSGLTGHLELDLESPASAQGRLSLAVARLSSGNPLQDRELRRRIDARRFPTIDGELRGLEPTDAPGRYRAHGTVTFRGVAREHEDEVEIALGDDGTAVVRGESTFDIRDHGMSPPRILVLQVEPKVTVRIEVVAIEGEG